MDFEKGDFTIFGTVNKFRFHFLRTKNLGRSVEDKYLKDCMRLDTILRVILCMHMVLYAFIIVQLKKN